MPMLWANICRSCFAFGLLVAVVALGGVSEAAAQPDTEGTPAAVAEDGPSEDQASSEAAARRRSRAESQPLKDRIKSVQRRRFLKRQRFELFPYFGLDLNDPFFQHYAAGLAAGYHIGESFSLELRGAKVLGRTQQSSVRILRLSEGAIFDDVPEFDWNADLNFNWSPIYGKLSLGSEWILHFDTYLTVGGGAFATKTDINPSFNVGIGQRIFLTDWLALRFEIRDYLFIDARETLSDLQNLLMLNISVSIFLPFSFDYESS